MPGTVAYPQQTSFALAWGAKVSTDFAAGILQVCRALSWTNNHASWLTSCIAFETGETFSANVRNAAGSGAVGLIQFMPATARALGTTVDNLALLSPASQLSYVIEYFRPYAERIHSLTDMYMAILLPSAVGKPDDTVLFTQGTVAYRQNAGLDVNSDGKITKAEAAAHVSAKFKRGMAPGFVAEYAGIVH